MSIRDSIAKTGAVLEGEFFIALKSKRIAQKYINCDPVFTKPALVDIIGGQLIKPYELKCNAVVGPAVGGIPLVYAAARALRIGNTSLDLRTAFAEKMPDGTFVFERMGFAKAVDGRKVVVVEDIMTTGGSTKSVIELVRRCGGTVIGVSVIWNRGNVSKLTLGVPAMHQLIDEPVESWDPQEHPEWGKLPLVQDVGHPGHFPDYPGPKTHLLAA